jgi:hypothetical protein
MSDCVNIWGESVSVFLRGVRRLLVTANVVPSSPILVTLMMEKLRFFETSVLTRATRRNIPEDVILHSHRRENLKSNIALDGWTLISTHTQLHTLTIRSTRNQLHTLIIRFTSSQLQTSPEMWCSVNLVITDVSEEHLASNFMVQWYSELGTPLAVTSN